MFSPQEINDITLTADVEKEEVKRKHIDWWPTATAALENLAMLIKNPFVKIAINAIVAIGGAIHNKLIENKG